MTTYQYYKWIFEDVYNRTKALHEIREDDLNGLLEFILRKENFEHLKKDGYFDDEINDVIGELCDFLNYPLRKVENEMEI